MFQNDDVRVFKHEEKLDEAVDGVEEVHSNLYVFHAILIFNIVIEYKAQLGSDKQYSMDQVTKSETWKSYNVILYVQASPVWEIIYIVFCNLA